MSIDRTKWESLYFHRKTNPINRYHRRRDKWVNTLLTLLAWGLSLQRVQTNLSNTTLGVLITFLTSTHHLQEYLFARNVTYREQGWRSGESTRLPPMWPRFESWRRRHMWVEFVAGSLPCSERFFSGYSCFPLSLKTNTFKFQFDLERTDTFQRVLMNSLVLRG